MNQGASEASAELLCFKGGLHAELYTCTVCVEAAPSQDLLHQAAKSEFGGVSIGIMMPLMSPQHLMKYYSIDVEVGSSGRPVGELPVGDICWYLTWCLT